MRACMCVCVCVCKSISVCMCARSCPSLASLWTIDHQAPLPLGFLRQEYWSGLLFPSPGHLPDLGIKLSSPSSLLYCRWDSLLLGHNKSLKVGSFTIALITFKSLEPLGK